jgi:CBS domain containing-hemolysin-like protein
MSIIPYISIIGLLMLSAFFSGSEIAFSSVNDSKLRQMVKNNNQKASAALHVHQNFDAALTTILIGNNLVNIAASSISTLIIINLVGDSGVFFSTVLMTVFILIFGEITPKLVAKKYSIEFTLNAAYPVLILMKILKPVNFVVVKFLSYLSKIWQKEEEENLSITEEEIMFLIDQSEDEGLMDEERSDLLKSSLVYHDIKAREILTPRIDILAIDVALDFEEIKKIVIDSSFTRIPVYEETIDNIIGILHSKEFLLKSIDEDEFDIRSILSETIYIYKTMMISDVFSTLNSQHFQMAIVVDEYGGTAGCVTVEDIIEELVGEIWDETDVVVEEVKEISNSTYLVIGDVALRDLVEYLDLVYVEIESEYNTVGGWTIEMFERLPEVGETCEYDNLTIKVTKVDETRVLEVQISIN